MKKHLIKTSCACVTLILFGVLLNTNLYDNAHYETIKAIGDEDEDSTSINASSPYVYYIGDIIYKEHITVEDNLGNQITDFVFASNGYQFTYSDAASGGELTEKIFANSISYNEMTCSLTVQVRRTAHYEIINNSETITAADLPATGSSFVSFSDVSKGSGFVYAGSSAKIDWAYIQFNCIYSDRGIVTTASGGYIKSITITIGKGGTTDVDVYASNSAYTSPSDLRNANKQGTLVLRTRSTTTVRLNGQYTYFGVRPNNGAVYLASIEVKYGNLDSAYNLSSYIMYEDTEGQCQNVGETKGKYTISEDRFLNELSAEQRTTFMNSNDYVVSHARERFIAWAAHLGKTIEYEDGDYIFRSMRKIAFKETIKEPSLTIVAIITSIFITSMLSICLVYKRKK